jgi:hypothetical protein
MAGHVTVSLGSGGRPRFQASLRDANRLLDKTGNELPAYYRKSLRDKDRFGPKQSISKWHSSIGIIFTIYKWGLQ